jgi:hypothetical protein
MNHTELVYVETYEGAVVLKKLKVRKFTITSEITGEARVVNKCQGGQGNLCI